MEKLKFEVEYDFDKSELVIQKNKKIKTVYSSVNNKEDLVDCLRAYVGADILNNKNIKVMTMIKIGDK